MLPRPLRLTTVPILGGRYSCKPLEFTNTTPVDHTRGRVASTRAYTAVVYLPMETSADTVVRFITAKIRVAPIQPQTIPWLELLSALLLSRLITTVAEGLN